MAAADFLSILVPYLSLAFPAIVKGLASRQALRRRRWVFSF